MIPAKYSPTGKRRMIIGSERKGTNTRESVARQLAVALGGKAAEVLAPRARPWRVSLPDGSSRSTHASGQKHWKVTAARSRRADRCGQRHAWALVDQFYGSDVHSVRGQQTARSCECYEFKGRGYQPTSGGKGRPGQHLSSGSTSVPRRYCITPSPSIGRLQTSSPSSSS